MPTAEKMLDELTPHRSKYLFRRPGAEREWMFRGQTDAAWGLTPSAMRPNALYKYVAAQTCSRDRTSLLVKERLRLEQEMVVSFAVLADNAGFHLPGDSWQLRNDRDMSLNPIEFPSMIYHGLFALAQHYGVPTRFLDWTPMPLIAAYFACIDAAEINKPYKIRSRQSDKHSENCAIWAVSQSGIEMIRTDVSWNPRVRIVSAPAALVPNLAAQRGRFTLVQYHNGSEAAQQEDPPDLDQLLRGQRLKLKDHHPGSPLLYKFLFPASEANKLLYFLSRFDITAARIFPGLSGVERSMYEKNFHNKP